MLAPRDEDSSTPANSADAWAALITASWRESFRAILEVGRLLQKAKDALPHGEFGRMCEERLPFSASTAQRLMAIANDPRITNPAHVQHLPQHWGTLYELTKLDDEEFQQGIERGVIRPDMLRNEVNGARAIMGSRVEPADSLDYFPTPPWATRALVEQVMPLLGERGDLSVQAVWEPACGEGHIAEVLAEYCDTVHASDIHDYGYADAEVADFLNIQETRAPVADWIITNPPFGELAESFTLRALQLARVGVAMFVRLQWLEGVRRFEKIFSPNPPTIIAQFAERVPLHKGRWEPDGATATAYLWILWLKEDRPETRFFWIAPGQREALTRANDAERFTTHPVTARGAA